MSADSISAVAAAAADDDDAATAAGGIKENDLLNKLLEACSEGNRKLAEDIIINNPELNITAANSSGDTPLHVAAAAGHVDIAKLLKSHNVPLDLQNPAKDCALHYAARSGQLPFIAFLKDEGVDLNAQNEAGQTAIHLAARAGFCDVIEWLVHSGANCNVQDIRGCTALHVACYTRQMYAALVLLHCGCQMDILDQAAMTALHIACRGNLLPVVQALCARGCSVDKKTQDGATPLHLAAVVGNPELVRFLVLAGADIDDYNQDGVQAEEIARAQGHTEVADLLSRLTSSIVRDRGETYSRQLAPTKKPFSRIRVNILGNSAVGKTTLIESLKCGYIRSLFRRSGRSVAASTKAAATVDSQASGAIEMSPSRDRVHDGTGKTCCVQLAPTNLQYTRGVDVQQVNITTAGDLSIWEYSGYEPYYIVYDRFLGDPNAIYVVVVSLRDDITERRKQIDFWFNFIRTRTMPFEPIGFGGAKLWAPRVLLVATHADLEPELPSKTGSSTSSSGKVPIEEGSSGSSPDFDLLDSIFKMYYADLAVEPHVFRLDANQAMGAEMKLLRQTLAGLKKYICESLPPALGILDATLAILADWRRVLATFPVVSWPSFAEYIRSKVNVLATEEHLRELLGQLHVLGEVVSVSRLDREMIIINPRWLCADIIGRLLTYDSFVQSPRDGRLNTHQLQAIFPKVSPKDAAFVLDGLELCHLDRQSNEDQFVVLSFSGTLEPADGQAPVTDQEVIGGFHIFPQFSNQLLHVFPRIAYTLYQRFHCQTPTVVGGTATGQQDSQGSQSVTHWSSGAQVTRGHLASVIRLVGCGEGLTVICRGPVEQRKELFFFQEDICDVIYTVLESCCPALYLERAPLSVCDLRANPSSQSPPPHVYPPHTIALAQLAGITSVHRTASSSSSPTDSEQLCDLVAFGSAEVFSQLRPGIDQPVSMLSLYARYRLAALLDLKDGRRKDWRALAALLGLAAEAGQLEKQMAAVTEAVATVSPTDLMLAEWTRLVGETAATIRALHSKLMELDRSDVIDMLLSVTPLYRYVVAAMEDGVEKSHEGGGVAGDADGRTTSGGSTSSRPPSVFSGIVASPRASVTSSTSL